MKQAVRRILIVLLALVCVVSLVMVIRRGLDYRTGQQVYQQAETLAQLPEELPVVSGEPAPEETEEPDPCADLLSGIDLAALQAVNPQVLGWIVLPGTEISYPLVQGDDNAYYLKHTWDLTSSAVGAIFMEYRNHSDLTDFNTLIYGHRMKNGSMFAALKNYKSQDYWAAAPCIYLTDGADVWIYDIFAAYEVPISGAAYQLSFAGDDEKQAFLDDALARSALDTGITPTVQDRIVTLSTCTGSGHATRWVVQGVLRSGE